MCGAGFVLNGALLLRPGRRVVGAVGHEHVLGVLPVPGELQEYRGPERRRDVVGADRGHAAWQTVYVSTTSDARAWAKRRGLEVSERGRLPASLLQAFREDSADEGAPPKQGPASETLTRVANKPLAKAARSRTSAKKTPSAARRVEAAATADGGRSDTAELFGDQQSVLRRLTALEAQVAGLVATLEAAAQSLTSGRPSGR